MGRRTHRLFREAGVVDIDVDPIIRAHPPGHSRRPIFRDFINNVRDRLIDGGFLSRDDLERDLGLFEARLGAMRGSGESYSDVILRIATTERP